MDIKNITAAGNLIDELREIERTILYIEKSYCTITAGHSGMNCVPVWTLNNPATQKCIKEALIKRKQQIEEELSKL